MIENFRAWAQAFVDWLMHRRKTPPPGLQAAAPVAERETVDQSFIDEVVKETVRQIRLPNRPPRPRRPKVDMKLKRDILDQLDDNTKIVGRMKTYFPTEYGLYSQVGAVIVPHDDPFLDWKETGAAPVSPWFAKARPAFGAVVTGEPKDETRDKHDPLFARVIHFLKIKEPKELRKRMFNRDHLTIQPIAATSDLYIFTLYYDEQDFARLFPKKTREDWKMCKFFERAFAVELPVEITQDGRARPLKVKYDRLLKFGRHGVCVKDWDYPYSKEYVAQLKIEEKPTQKEFILIEVGLCLRCYEEANASMIQVRALKNGVCTLINVNVETTPGFFDDREQVFVDGVRKRIFHIVRAHERIGSRGVRLHFRGLRKFVWNGYQIEISVPGRDHIDINDFNIAARSDIEARNGHDLGDVGAWLVANQKARWGAMVGKAGKMIPLKGWRSSDPPATPQ